MGGPSKLSHQVTPRSKRLESPDFTNHLKNSGGFPDVTALTVHPLCHKYTYVASVF
jgi:hypothetical protein